MISDKKAGIFLACGLLVLMLGSMPLNGYLLFLFWPAEFHRDPSTGSVPHRAARHRSNELAWTQVRFRGDTRGTP